MWDSAFIVVSGLPASGKSAIGRQVATKIGLPFLDKDDFLEREFEKHSSIDMALRQQLSRESDERMAAEALRLGSGVLVSFWRPSNQTVAYGTATDWLSELVCPVVELHCRCDPEIARQRFLGRVRHPGHNDALRLDGLLRQFEELAALGPIGLWPVATIETTHLGDIQAVSDHAIDAVLALPPQNASSSGDSEFRGQYM